MSTSPQPASNPEFHEPRYADPTDYNSPFIDISNPTTTGEIAVPEVPFLPTQRLDNYDPLLEEINRQNEAERQRYLDAEREYQDRINQERIYEEQQRRFNDQLGNQGSGVFQNINLPTGLDSSLNPNPSRPSKPVPIPWDDDPQPQPETVKQSPSRIVDPLTQPPLEVKGNPGLRDLWERVSGNPRSAANTKGDVALDVASALADAASGRLKDALLRRAQEASGIDPDSDEAREDRLNAGSPLNPYSPEGVLVEDLGDNARSQLNLPDPETEEELENFLDREFNCNTYLAPIFTGAVNVVTYSGTEVSTVVNENFTLVENVDLSETYSTEYPTIQEAAKIATGGLGGQALQPLLPGYDRLSEGIKNPIPGVRWRGTGASGLNVPPDPYFDRGSGLSSTYFDETEFSDPVTSGNQTRRTWKLRQRYPSSQIIQQQVWDLHSVNYDSANNAILRSSIRGNLAYYQNSGFRLTGLAVGTAEDCVESAPNSNTTNQDLGDDEDMTCQFTSYFQQLCKQQSELLKITEQLNCDLQTTNENLKGLKAVVKNIKYYQDSCTFEVPEEYQASRRNLTRTAHLTFRTVTHRPGLCNSWKMTVHHFRYQTANQLPAWLNGSIQYSKGDKCLWLNLADHAGWNCNASTREEALRVWNSIAKPLIEDVYLPLREPVLDDVRRNNGRIDFEGMVRLSCIKVYDSSGNPLFSKSFPKP